MNLQIVHKTKKGHDEKTASIEKILKQPDVDIKSKVIANSGLDLLSHNRFS